uniref:RRM domain-containing protein n=1 Tax=Arcella intermedia TaxID=1963864 RepID=A0A6B2LRB8_9EUKA
MYVGGLEENVDEKSIYDLFGPFGEVKDVTMPNDERSQKHRGFAFVEFEEAEDAYHALDNLNNAEFYGRVLKLNYAKPEAVAKNKALWENEEYLQKDIEPKKPQQEEPAPETTQPTTAQ